MGPECDKIYLVFYYIKCFNADFFLMQDKIKRNKNYTPTTDEQNVMETIHTKKKSTDITAFLPSFVQLFD